MYPPDTYNVATSLDARWGDDPGRQEGWETVADLATHLSVTAVVVGMGASAYLGAGMVSPREALLLWAAGTLGGVLPDLDADHSKAVRAIFGAAGMLAGALVMVAVAGRVSIVEMWVAFGVIYGTVTWPLRRVFAGRTRHRGALHSLVAGLFCAVFTVVLAFRVAGAPAAFSWLFGVALLLGFIVHLVLDEVSSVDLVYVRVKASFGSAFKLLDREAPGASALLAICSVVGLFVLAPRPGSIDDLFFNGHAPGLLVARFWPRSWGGP